MHLRVKYLALSFRHAIWWGLYWVNTVRSGWPNSWASIPGRVVDVFFLADYEGQPNFLADKYLVLFPWR
jgi:hypothetical protein